MGRSMRGRFSGVVRYTDQLVRHLSPRLGDDLTVFLTRAPDGLDGLTMRRVRAPFPTPNEYLRALWEQTVVPLEVARLRPDVYHSPNYILPLAVSCPTVVTIHDLFYLDAALHRLRSHLYLTVLATQAIRRATRIICLSAYTRDRLLERFPEAAARVRLVGEGVDPRFRPPAPEAVARAREAVGFDEPYVLFVGTVEPRKNLPRLIRAFGTAVGRGRLPHRLVIAGGQGWKDGPVREAYESSPVKGRIRLAGYVADDLLPAVYGGADVFAYPSQAEGFGLPPLEAMACGTPVLASKAASLPEVVGDAGLLVDPQEVEQMAAALELLILDERLRADLRRKGYERAAAFSWEAAARKMLTVYRRLGAA